MAGDFDADALPSDVPELPDGWEWRQLFDFVSDGRSISYGVVQPGDHDPNGIPILRAENVQNSRVELRDVMRVSPSIESKYKRTRLSGGEVLITLVGAYFGKVAVAPHSASGYNTARAVGVVPVKSDNLFLSYALQSAVCQRYIQSWATTTAQPTLNLGDVGRIPIPTPPSKQRQAIAAMLAALDDKIELNRRMNATLEATARALFQSWFVDFDPVRAKLDCRKPDGLDKATAALFPATFQHSPLGPIPRGWTAQRMPDAIEVNPRRTLKSGVLAPYLDMKNLPTQGHSADEVVEREFTSGTKFQNGDTLLARITPCLENGKTGFVDFLDEGQVGWGSTEYIVLAPKPPLPSQFGYLLARSDALRAHAIQNMTGTSGRQRVPSECFNTFHLAVSSPEIARRFDELTAPLMSKIKSNAHESRTLAALRDTLLPKLLSGELTVRDTERHKEMSA
jgi:type I restriction enzyme S subunit